MIIEPLEFIKGPFEVAPGRVIEARVYEGGPPGVSGGVYGLDTETELITSKAFTPPLVLLQVCDGRLAELVPYERAAEYLSHFDPDREPFLFSVFNVGFDMSVIRDYWPHVMSALDRDMVIDVGLRSNLYDISTRGFTAQGERLDTLVSRKLRFEISKDESVRLTYTRDMTLTRKHIKYGAIDAAVTRWLADAIPPQPTEFIQTRAGFALSEISRNGLLIDRPEFDKKRSEIQASMAEDAERLRSFGFNPDSTVAPKDHKEALAAVIGCELRDLASFRDVKALLGLLVASMEARDTDALMFSKRDPIETEISVLGSIYKRWVGGEIRKSRTKSDPRLAYEALFDEYARARGMEELATARKIGVMLQAARLMLDRFKAGDGLEEATLVFKNEYERTACWDEGRWVKPVAFLQERIKLLEQTSGVDMPKTDSGNAYESGKQLLTTLKLNGIQDGFFDVFVRYKHNEKLLGTYLKPEDIGEDGRWHPRFTTILRTGRTSCSKPNAFISNQLQLIQAA